MESKQTNKQKERKQRTKLCKHTKKNKNKKSETPATSKQCGGGADGSDLIPNKERSDNGGEKEKIKIEQRNYTV